MKTRYRARKNPWPFAVLCLLTAAAGAALGYAAFYLRFSPLYLVSFSAFMFAAQMFSVFVLPAYDYELDGPFLRIYSTSFLTAVQLRPKLSRKPRKDLPLF